MGNVLHIAAMNYPLPLVRDNSIVETWSGQHALFTDFGNGYRVVFFGDDVDDLLRRLGEAGKVAWHEDDQCWYIYHCDGCRDTREGEPFEGVPTRCGECA